MDNMERLFKQLLKKLNEAYPKSVSDKELVKNGISEEVIQDAIDAGLVKYVDNLSLSIITEESNIDSGQTESFLKITPEGSKYLGEAKQKSNNKSSIKFNIRNSKNVNAIAGSKNSKAVINNIQNQPNIHTLPYSTFEQGMINLGRWLMKKLYGSLDHTIRKFVLAVLILNIVTGIPLIIFFNTSIQLYTIIPFLITIIFGWGFIITSEETKCPRCKKRFAFTRKSRILENTADLTEKEILNYKSSYSCDYCNFKRKNVPEVVEIQKTSE